MPKHTPLSPAASRLLRAVRDARFAEGLACVHCSDGRVQRWGLAHGRQRYRCLNCNRTFSDLTGTPMAYSKRLDHWPRYFQCMEWSATVRAAAAFTRIHHCTAFRWRHRLLSAAHAADVTWLSGAVELTSFAMRYSEKGSRRPVQRSTRPVYVLCARDRFGNSFSTLEYGRSAQDYERLLSIHIDNGAAILTDARRFTGGAVFARRHAAHYLPCIRFTSLSSPSTDLVHIGNVMAEIRRLRDWLARFRGVATRYLPNYLVWHRCLDRTAEVQLEPRWVQATSSSPTLPANTS